MNLRSHTRHFILHPSSLPWRCFEQVGVVYGDAPVRVRRAVPRDRAFVAVDADAALHLQVQRAVSKLSATLDALAAADTQILVDRVLIEWLLDIRAPKRSDRAQFVFRAAVAHLRPRLQVCPAEVAVTANLERVNAFHRRRIQYACRRTTTALLALRRIELPYRPLRARLRGYPSPAARRQHRRCPDKIAPADSCFFIHRSPLWIATGSIL